MVNQTSIYSGASLFQEAFPLSNFICSDNDGLIFVPSNLDPAELVTTSAYITHQPDDPNSIWAGVDIDWSRITTDPTSILHALFTLYGITPNGDTVQVGEKVITSCPTTLLRETQTFNTLQSACEPALTLNPALAPAGKFNLNLPMTYKNFDDCELYPSLPDLSSPKIKVIPITGSIDGNESYWGTGPITISYASSMNVDFSDLRFYQWNGSSFISIPYLIIRKTNSVSAVVFLQIPSLPASPTISYVYMVYGNSTYTSASAPISNLYYYDDFEDGLFTGRTAPYLNWIYNGYGTYAVTNSSPINGTYSLKMTGNGSDSVSNRLMFPDTNPYFSCSFNFKLLTQGVATAVCPYIVLLYMSYTDTSNYSRLETSYNGTYQVLQIRQAIAGVTTVYGSMNLLTGKMPINTTYKFYVRQMATGWMVYVNGVSKIGVSATIPSTCSYKGISANIDSQGMWDNFIFHPATGYAAYIGNEPAIGTISAEGGSSILPDSTGNDFTQLAFSKPPFWIDGYPGYFTTRKPANYNIPTRSVPMSATNTFSLGYDGMDKFDALRLGIFVTANSNYNLNINSVTFRTG
jgi:hypothetical protein